MRERRLLGRVTQDTHTGRARIWLHSAPPEAPGRALGLHTVLTAQGVQGLHQDVGSSIFQDGWVHEHRQAPHGPLGSQPPQCLGRRPALLRRVPDGRGGLAPAEPSASESEISQVGGLRGPRPRPRREPPALPAPASAMARPASSALPAAPGRLCGRHRPLPVSGVPGGVRRRLPARAPKLQRPWRGRRCGRG